MELLITVSCADEVTDHLATIGAGAGTPLAILDGDSVIEVSAPEQVDHPSALEAQRYWQEANDWIASLNGSLWMLSPFDDPPVRLRNVRYRLSTGEIRPLPITGTGWMELSPFMGLQDKVAESGRFASLARSNGPVAKVLRLIGREQDWTNLYRIYEVVQHEVGGAAELKGKGWIAKSALEEFTKTANHPRLSHDDARHGVQSGQPTGGMDLREARSLISKLVRAWLRSIELSGVS